MAQPWIPLCFIQATTVSARVIGVFIVLIVPFPGQVEGAFKAYPLPRRQQPGGRRHRLTQGDPAVVRRHPPVRQHGKPTTLQTCGHGLE